MFNKINTKYLAITFFILFAIVVLVNVSGNDKRNRSFKSILTNFDTAAVSNIIVYPKAGGEIVSFEKKRNKWFVLDKDGEYNADMSQVRSILNSLVGLKAKRLAAKSKDKWKKYELTDSAGIRVELKSNDKTLADLYIGKFSYSQPPQGANPYMQGGRGTMTNYVRLTDETEVYAVEGFLSMTFNRQLKDFRDNKVLQVQKDSLLRILFNQLDKSYNLIKNDSIWLIDGLVTDSTAVTNFLSNLSNLRSNDFLAKNAYPVGTATHAIKFENWQGKELVKVEAFYNDSTNIAISSSINPGTFFDGVKSGLFEKLFKADTIFKKMD